MSYSRNCMVNSLLMLASFTLLYAIMFPPCFFHGLIAHLVLMLNNIHCLDVPHLDQNFDQKFTNWRTSWLPLHFSSYEQSCSKYPHTGFCVGVNFQLLWVNTKEHNCWLTWKTMFNFVKTVKLVLILCSHHKKIRIFLDVCVTDLFVFNISILVKELTNVIFSFSN